MCCNLQPSNGMKDQKQRGKHAKCSFEKKIVEWMTWQKEKGCLNDNGGSKAY